MRSAKKQLPNELDLSSWSMLERSNAPRGIQDGVIAVALIARTPRKNPYVDKLRLRLTEAVYTKLGWENGDSVCVYNNPDDQLSFVAVKRPGGWKLTKEQGKAKVLGFACAWPNKFQLNPTNATVIDHKIHKLGYLMFRLTSEDE